ncbi:MAG TPA: hydrogenase formation protein HypD [Sulfuricurvum sp.]|nr:MAG: hydrogenase formation protein HypD [Campylobacterales bacterium 16-40-21]OZA03860.1 MAG: hydrogenase formation protein HypD [Sulfuricurvum sp. 17-40-25]HQS65620.1 hydrogenase formation protein HypD [Sulfuricurvum sp.]HQT36126.1 hydrogenase formation protein HypD [Sulfuricurvum sp.]
MQDDKALFDIFRHPQTIQALSRKIYQEALKLSQPLKIMEVCGGHTHTIMKYGLKQLLPDTIEFIHGPGCPVCIMPKERIDQAIDLARMRNTILLTLGDMIRVPGSESSLVEERARGCDIRPLYSPMDALKIAAENPTKKVIFFAIGFETTTPMTAALILRADNEKLHNLFFHINHVLVPPAVHAIMDDPQNRIDAFIGPSHVSVITGSKIYEPIAKQYETPVVVSGFEPVDVMEGILQIIAQKNENRSEVEVQYSRAVTRDGNHKAQAMIEQTMNVRDTFRWRGLGDIEHSALQLGENYAHLDAEAVFSQFLSNEPIDDHKLCICGSILKGLAKPNDCTVFGTACTPNSPLGSCMVSSEGSCNAYYRYGNVV